ncbi:ABC transporter permease [Thermodesulfobacteriota bacterium]
MRGFYAVFRKEMANFFASPIAYVVIAGFLLFAGLFFSSSLKWFSYISVRAASAPQYADKITVDRLVTQQVIPNMAVILLFLACLLTMRLFAEEKRSGSIELLLTYPIRDTAIMFGKFLAVMAVLAITLAASLPMWLFLFSLSEPDAGPLIGGYLGLLLMGSAFMSLGLFISSLSENQVVAAVFTFVAALMFWLLSWMSSLMTGTVAEVLGHVSMIERLESFNKGVLSLSDVSFFILFTAFFLFLTLRSLETHRWRG